MLGYYKNPKQTNEVMVNDWLCTKDIASITSRGWLKIHGRSDEMIIRAGMNIYPQEIEAALKQDTRTKEVLAYGYKNQHGTCIGIDINGNFDDEQSVFELCKKVLPGFQMPTSIKLVSELPKNASGKIIRCVKNA